MALALGARLGPYEILAPLGAGGMGEVYRARDTRLERTVAIKILPSQFSSDPVRKQRFEREAKAISSLNHPHICVLHDVGNQDGVDYLVMECIEGETLAKRLEKGPVALDQVLKYGAQIAGALDKAHQNGVVHRDLKPGNIMLTSSGAKLLDFGLAKPAVTLSLAATLTVTTPSSPVTEQGTIVGTFLYMSPEQVEGKELDGRSDIFSLGTVLYEMVTGRKAFEGKSQLSVASAILEKEPEPISSIRKLTPRAFERVVSTCLRKDPEERYQSARDVSLNLKWVAEEGSQEVSAQKAARAGLRWQRILPWAIAGVLLVAGAAIWRKYGSISAIEIPRYHQLTFERGLIYAARFAADGRSVIYSASWEGQPVQLYATDPGSPESRALSLSDSTLFAVSAGQLAISLGCRHLFIGNCEGTLAIVPISGGAPRETAEGVAGADWTTDGNGLAVIREVRGKFRVEYPLGKVIYDSDTRLADLRVAPGDSTLAFVQIANVGSDIGRVVVVNREGKELTHTETFISVQGLAWSPTGNEVWVGATTDEAWANAIYALRLDGKQRMVLRLPGVLRLHDVSRDGRILLSKDWWRSEIRFRRAGEEKERRLSWLDYGIATDISADGKTIILMDTGAASGVSDLGYVRATDGSPAVKLGTWTDGRLSPDGKRALAIDGADVTSTQLAIVPVGAGQIQTLQSNGMQTVATLGWMPDGREIYFFGNDGHGWRAYKQDIGGGAAHAITPLISMKLPEAHVVSPDGKFVFARDLSGKAQLYPLNGGEAQEVKGWLPEDIWSAWSKDGREGYVFHDEGSSAKVYRLDVRTGTRVLVTKLGPADPAGVTSITGVHYTPDGKCYVYNYTEQRSDLFLVERVR